MPTAIETHALRKIYAAPPARKRGGPRTSTFAPRTAYGEQMSRTLETHVAVRGGTVVAAEMFEDDGSNPTASAERLAKEVKIDDPSLPAALYARLFAEDDGKTHSLIWTRSNARRQD